MIGARPLDDFVAPNLKLLVGLAKDFFGDHDCWIIRVPARLCLAADHTDYWEAFTPELVTFASDSALMTAVISPRTDSIVRLFNVGDFDDCEFDLNEGTPPRAVNSNSWLEWLDTCGTPSAHWSNYVLSLIHI